MSSGRPISSSACLPLASEPTVENNLGAVLHERVGDAAADAARAAGDGGDLPVQGEIHVVLLQDGIRLPGEQGGESFAVHGGVAEQNLVGA